MSEFFSVGRKSVKDRYNIYPGSNTPPPPSQEKVKLFVDYLAVLQNDSSSQWLRLHTSPLEMRFHV